jgi:hypothetical protein
VIRRGAIAAWMSMKEVYVQAPRRTPFGHAPLRAWQPGPARFSRGAVTD